MDDEIKVIKIVNDTTLVINAGSEDYNIKIGDELQILDADGESLVDPTSGDEIGKLPIYKSKVFVTDIYDYFSIVRSKYIEATKTNGSIFNSITGATVIPAHRIPMNVNEDEITGGLFDSEDHPINVGDIAKPIN
ncbi:hypothetical protein [Weissella paramesenteroides]|uniref:hypothetical protein n=1 Tax=Weissella paramesenteroides TaxID=1249 RepID=UPI00388ECAF3